MRSRGRRLGSEEQGKQARECKAGVGGKIVRSRGRRLGREEQGKEAR